MEEVWLAQIIKEEDHHPILKAVLIEI